MGLSTCPLFISNLWILTMGGVDSLRRPGWNLDSGRMDDDSPEPRSGPSDEMDEMQSPNRRTLCELA